MEYFKEMRELTVVWNAEAWPFSELNYGPSTNELEAGQSASVYMCVCMVGRIFVGVCIWAEDRNAGMKGEQ